ncbi:MAG: hypothetical protein ABIR47_16235 [Candidatus Kapaibacterium sp.]
MEKRFGQLLGMGIFGITATLYLILWSCFSNWWGRDTIPWLLIVVALPAMIAGYLVGGRMQSRARLHPPLHGLIPGAAVTVLAYGFCWVIEILIGSPLGALGHDRIGRGDMLIAGILYGILICLLPALPFGMAAGFLFYWIVGRRERLERGELERG